MEIGENSSVNTAEQIAAQGVKEFLSGSPPRVPREGVTYAFANQDSVLYKRRIAACFSALNGTGYGRFSDVFVVCYNGMYATNSYCQPEHQIHYIDYILNRSPFSEACIDKDAQSVYDKGYITISTHTPADISFGAAHAFRYMFERVGALEIFTRLIQSGVTEDLAFLACCCTNPTTSGVKQGFRLISDSSHNPICSTGMSLEAVSTFCGYSNRKVETRPYTIKDFGGYKSGIHKHFSYGATSQDNNSLYRYLKDNLEVYPEENIKTNPFSSVITDKSKENNFYPADLFINAMVITLKKLEEELK